MATGQWKLDTPTLSLSAYEKHKPAIYKWRELNRQKYNKICNKTQVYTIRYYDSLSTSTSSGLWPLLPRCL